MSPISFDSFEQLSLFQGLKPKQLEILYPLFVPYECYSGTIIFEQGDPADYLYLIVDGEAIIHYKPEDGEAITITRVRSGGVVGWSAAIGRRKYTSGASCAEYTKMLRIRATDLNTLRQQDPEIGSFLFDRLANLVAQRGSAHPQVMALLNNNMSGGEQG
jgi:CRP/FNR family transcriptional regulator, cyclic AMP receptor protein